MNERLFLKLLLVLFLGLIAAEIVVVSLFGLKLELILLCFIIAAALTGILFVVRLLFSERPDIDSVSVRRAKQKSNHIMQDRLKEYTVDEEFLGANAFSHGKGNSQKFSDKEPHVLKPDIQKPPVLTSIEEAIRVHAEMYGGLDELQKMIQKIDETSFERLLAKAGFGRISREEIILQIALMANSELDSVETNREQQCILDGHSMDRDSFDEYIRRCMNVSDEESEASDKGFSVELDQEGLSRGTGPMPADFSHDPKAVFSKLNKQGKNS
ncbi:MAG: hypothetical protein WCL43_02795 [Chlorobium sp.]|jgi:uncharacterized integral membrane protein|nr:MAG: hypothetical protein FDX12_01430 [Chlorobium sp.]